jgi:hypothetical protein
MGMTTFSRKKRKRSFCILGKEGEKEGKKKKKERGKEKGRKLLQFHTLSLLSPPGTHTTNQRFAARGGIGGPGGSWVIFEQWCARPRGAMI